MEVTLYLIHVELAHIKISDRNEIWAWDLHHSTALVEVAKSLAPSNVKGHGEVLYLKPWLKSNGTWRIPEYSSIARCISAIRRSTQRKWSML